MTALLSVVAEPGQLLISVCYGLCSPAGIEFEVQECILSKLHGKSLCTCMPRIYVKTSNNIWSAYAAEAAVMVAAGFKIRHADRFRTQYCTVDAHACNCPLHLQSLSRAVKTECILAEHYVCKDFAQSPAVKCMLLDIPLKTLASAHPNKHTQHFEIGPINIYQQCQSEETQQPNNKRSASADIQSVCDTKF